MKAETILKAILIPGILWLTGGCALFTLDEIEWHSCPAEKGEILPEGAPPWIDFGVAVEKKTAEAALKITHSRGKLGVETRWEKNKLFLKPLDPPRPGIEYTLMIEGLITGEQGRRTRINEEIPFHFIHDKEPLRLLSVTPQDNRLITPDQPLILQFSEPPEALSWEEAFSLNPGTRESRREIWSEDRREVSLSPLPAEGNPQGFWEPFTRYEWNLSDELMDEEGRILDFPRQGSFLCGENSEPLLLTHAQPRDSLTGDLLGEWTGTALLELRFNSDWEPQTWARGVTLSPAAPGYWSFPEPRRALFHPREPWQTGEEYTLTISSELKDSRGYPFPEHLSALPYSFTAAPPAQELLSLHWEGAQGSHTFTADDLEQLHALPKISPGETQEALYVTLTFKETVDPGLQDSLGESLRLTGWAPRELGSPLLFYWHWFDPKTLRAGFSHFPDNPPPEDTQEHFYRFSLNQEMTTTPEGGEMKEEPWIIISTR